MKDAREVLKKLTKKYDIYVATVGTHANLTLKRLWLKENLHFAKFIGCCSDDGITKGFVNMEEATFIDDKSSMLRESNAEWKIAFGEIKSWNEDWINLRCFDWKELGELLL